MTALLEGVSWGGSLTDGAVVASVFDAYLTYASTFFNVQKAQKAIFNLARTRFIHVVKVGTPTRVSCHNTIVALLRHELFRGYSTGEEVFEAVHAAYNPDALARISPRRPHGGKSLYMRNDLLSEVRNHVREGTSVCFALGPENHVSFMQVFGRTANYIDAAGDPLDACFAPLLKSIGITKVNELNYEDLQSDDEMCVIWNAFFLVCYLASTVVCDPDWFSVVREQIMKNQGKNLAAAYDKSALGGVTQLGKKWDKHDANAAIAECINCIVCDECLVFDDEAGEWIVPALERSAYNTRRGLGNDDAKFIHKLFIAIVN